MKENDNFERAIIDAATFENMTKLYIETAKEQLIIDMLIKNIKEMYKLETIREATKYVYAALKFCKVETEIINRCAYLVENPKVMEEILNEQTY